MELKEIQKKTFFPGTFLSEAFLDIDDHVHFLVFEILSGKKK